ncbi:MAG: DoxX family protein [Bryobacteraceae bacterium]|nr:DoxX family protein [Bryobacteraceae bacterium]
MELSLESLAHFLFPSSFPAAAGSLALLACRIFLGSAFVNHGLGKWRDLHGFAKEFSIPPWLAGAAALSQIVSAILLIPGLLTPFAALSIGANMAVAVLKLVGKGEPFVNPHGHSWESAGFYAVMGVSLYLLGPGQLSIDWWLLQRYAAH